MDDFHGQCSNNFTSGGSPSDDDDNVNKLASSCPKKKAGRKKFKETRHPVYRGIRQRNGNRWVCEVRTPTNNSRIWLGSYATAEMAARAHDVAALALRGQNACLNFADSAWRLPVPVSTDTRDIQRAAAEAAELFRPPELEEPPTQDNNNNVAYENVTQNNTPPTQDNNNNVADENFSQINNNYEIGPETSSSAYMDEEALFNMPGLIDNMAEGLMLPPPNPSWGWDDNNDSDDGEVSLWNF